MGGQSGSSKYLFLLVWLGVLTVAMVAMAAILYKQSLNVKDDTFAQNTKNVTPAENNFSAPSKMQASPLSYIQLTMDLDRVSWQDDTDMHRCESCSLVLQNNSVHCRQEGMYFFYAQVTFLRNKEETDPKGQKRTVTLSRNARVGITVRKLFEGVYPSDKEGSVSVAKIVRLRKGDSVSLNITTNYRSEIRSTYWGAYQLL